MDRFTRDDLKRLIAVENDAAVSLYMPTYRAGREVRQNAIRFKNLAKRVEEQLSQREVAAAERRTLLAKLEKLETDDDWWQHQSDALALFQTSDRLETYRIPLTVDELVVVGPRIHLRPMVRMLQVDGPFYLLAASQNRVRLLAGTQYSISELEVEDLPSDLRSALNIDEYVESLQQHRSGFGDEAGALLFHGQGGAGMEVQKKDEIKQFFHRIDQGLCSYFGQEEAPLVFAGVDYLFPLFQEVCSYAHLMDTPVEGNPDELSPEELHPKAWKVVEPRFEKARTQALERYGDLADTDRATGELRDILRAARQGAVDTLVLSQEERQWGKIDEQTWQIEKSEAGERDAEDLLNYAALHTLVNGGKVFAESKHALPDQQSAVALLRYALP